MSVLRNLNILSQMRLDVPHIRLLESGVAGDFDAVVGRTMSGGKALVVKGFTISGAVGNPANTLQLVVADSSAINLNASESGSFLSVPSNAANETLDGAVNSSVLGSFVSGAVNYVSIDFVRQPDESTTDLVTFIDPVTKEESDRQVPLGKTLSYKIIVDTVPFSSSANLIPVAKVTVDAVGVVTAIQDARRMLFRLAAGGDAPNSYSSYSWPQGRYEAAFSGADKSLTNQKDWMDAVMTRLWEVGGGQNWFSPTADRNVWSINTGTPFSNGDYFELTGSTLKWAASKFFFDGSGGAYYNDVAADTSGTKTIAINQCLFVDLDRSSNATLTAQIANIADLGTGPRPGNRWILAWRNSDGVLYTRNWRYPVGTLFTPATNLAQGVVRLHAAAPIPLSPVVAMIGTNNTLVLTSTGGTVAGTFTGLFAGVKGVASYGGGGYGVWGVGADDAGGGASPGVYGVGGGGEVGGVGVKGRAGTDSGANGVEGEGSVTGAGVKGTGGASGNGVEGVAGGAAKSGVKGTGGAGGVGVEGVLPGATAGTGVKGTGGVGGSGGSFTGGTTNGTGVEGYGGGGNAYGVYGVGTGTNSGVKGTGGAANGNGVEGIGTGAGTGLRGEGGASGGNGAFAIGTGTSAAVVGLAVGSGRAFEGLGGSVGVQASETFEFMSAKTGVLMIPATDLIKVSGTGVLSGPGTPAYPSWSWVNGDKFIATIRVPRGSQITQVQVLLSTGTPGGETLGNPKITLNTWSATTLTQTAIGTGAGTFTAAMGVTPTGWFTIGGLAAVTVGDGSSDATSNFVTLDWTLSGAIASTIKIGGLKITYTYTTVDFMV